MIKPQIVTICIGAEEKEVILSIAYLTSDLVDHFDSPASLSATLNGICVVLNHTHEDKALKKEFFSFMLSSTNMTFLSRSLKSDAFIISILVSLEMIL